MGETKLVLADQGFPLYKILSFLLKCCILNFSKSHIKQWFHIYSIHCRPGTEFMEQSIRAFPE